jgi:phosphoribosyl-dephospho-CoA transferase
VRDVDALIWDGPRPEWATAALQLAPWVVVRRIPSRPGIWPVGIRGALRAQRCAAWLPDGAVQCVVPPQMLVATHAWRQRAGADAIPALAVLDQTEAVLHAHGYAGRWGPGGSVGFELASTVPCVSPSSDLDLVLSAADPIAVGDAAALRAALAELPVRVDVLLETPGGGVALAEYAGGSSVMLRAPEGPRLVANPWVASA